MLPKEEKISIYHATAPTCWWSWGYESVLNRLRLIYGDQIEIRLLIGTVYEDLQAWLKDYNLTDQSWRKWASESAKLMDLPIRTDYSSKKEPQSVLNATHAVLAAQLQKNQIKSNRFLRELIRMFVVEGKDVTTRDTIEKAAQTAGLNTRKLLSDWQDKESVEERMHHQRHGFPEVPLGFYNLVVSDDRGRTVMLDNAFDPRLVEEAIDYLSKGGLSKTQATDIEEYLRAEGASPLTEVARVFGMSKTSALEKLSDLEGKGDVKKVTLAGAAHWTSSSS